MKVYDLITCRVLAVLLLCSIIHYRVDKALNKFLNIIASDYWCCWDY